MASRSNKANMARSGVAILAVVLLAACSTTDPSDDGDGGQDAGALPTATAPGSSAPEDETGAALSGGDAAMSGRGITDASITIGQIAPVTGPVPGLGQSAFDALTAFAAYVNSEGGINGRTLEVEQVDDALDCATHTNAATGLATDVFAVVGTFTPVDACGASVLAANPDMASIYGDILTPTLFDSPNAFAAMTRPPGYITNGYQFVADNFPDAITAVGNLYPAETGEFLLAQLTAASESLGFETVYSRGLAFSETNFTSDIIRMREEGVRIVDLSANDVNVVASFVQQAAQAGFVPDIILAPSAYDADFVDLIGESASTDNLVAPLFFPMFLGEDRDTNPALDNYLTWLEDTVPDAEPDYLGVAAWSAGVLFAQAVQAAGESGEVTQAALVDSLADFGAFSAAGMLPETDPGQRIGPDCAAIVGLRDGEWVRLDVTSGYSCEGKYFVVDPAGSN